MDPKPGDFVLWKPYGFRHIIKEGTRTLCGNDFGHTLRLSQRAAARYRELANTPGLMPHEGANWLAMATYWENRIKYGDKAAESRPLCGTCRRLKEHHESNRGRRGSV